MKFQNSFKTVLIIFLSVFTLSSCFRTEHSKSTLTGWNFNDPHFGNFTAPVDYRGQKTPPGMVLIEGGTFTMGHVQDDVMFDWNSTPVRQQLRSFYIDEAEVTNKEYSFYLEYLSRVFPQSDTMDINKRIYQAALPDTLVWRDNLGSTGSLSETYLRHPAFANYPVVGVSWLQAVGYCKWRTDRVNERILMDKGILKPLFADDSISVEGENHFVTQTYLKNPYLLFNGDSSIYSKGVPVRKSLNSKRGIFKKRSARKSRNNTTVIDTLLQDTTLLVTNDNPLPKKPEFTGRHVTISDGLLVSKYRLPTEAEWEYAAKAEVENREYNTIRGRKKYTWNGKYTRDNSKRYKGDMLANYKQGQGDYSGLAGWSSDGADITAEIKSYKPNAFGLYNMSGNVAEWVADVYRPIIDSQANDFNYFRGTNFLKTYIDSLGKVVVLDYNNLVLDTLNNGKIVPNGSPGEMKYVPITKDDAFMRYNYRRANNANQDDGDLASNKYFYKDEDDAASIPRMYNSPQNKIEVDEQGRVVKKYDTKNTRRTLINNNLRVYKGGSWKDRAYWLDPAQRRYLPEYAATDYIGFRCAMDRLGSSSLSKDKRAHFVKRK
ncbi:MAG: gliding motility lipoprotein GldJ [Flavobacteriales bacterium]|jgi:formylglycine-generating enzyme|nr:gliding motility lipoprotein GldJ [Flavobacteriales bacterium]